MQSLDKWLRIESDEFIKPASKFTKMDWVKMDKQFNIIRYPCYLCYFSHSTWCAKKGNWVSSEKRNCGYGLIRLSSKFRSYYLSRFQSLSRITHYRKNWRQSMLNDIMGAKFEVCCLKNHHFARGLQLM